MKFSNSMFPLQLVYSLLFALFFGTEVVFGAQSEDNESDGTDLLLTWKMILMVVIIISSVLGVVLPKVFLKYGGNNSDVILSLCNSFAGGVVFGVALIHLLPEAIDEWAELHPDIGLPIIMYATTLGFMLLIFVENIVVQQGTHTHKEKSSINEFKNDDYPLLNDGETGNDVKIVQNDEELNELFTSYTLMCALCFHSVIEGFALGMLTDLSDLILVFIAIIAHKGVAAFALGTSMAKAEMPLMRYSILGSIFTFATPLGIILAIFILAFVDPNQNVSDSITLVTEGVASGTFLFIATMEIFVVEFKGSHLFIPKFLLAMAGIIIMALVSIWS